MHRSQSVALLIAALGGVGLFAADAPQTAFDRVSSGTIKIYTVDDLTRGQQVSADQIATLLTETVAPDAWKGEWRSAALRATPARLTVKAPQSVQDDIATLLNHIREARNLFVRLNYQVVTAQTRRGDVVANALHDDGFTVVSRTVGDSMVTIENGAEAVLFDGPELKLPSLSISTTVSADRKAVTFALSGKVADSNSGSFKSMSFSSPVDQSVAVRIAAVPGEMWLILEPQLVERHWTPLGTSRLVARD